METILHAGIYCEEIWDTTPPDFPFWMKTLVSNILTHPNIYPGTMRGQLEHQQLRSLAVLVRQFLQETFECTHYSCCLPPVELSLCRSCGQTCPTTLLSIPDTLSKSHPSGRIQPTPQALFFPSTPSFGPFLDHPFHSCAEQ